MRSFHGISRSIAILSRYSSISSLKNKPNNLITPQYPSKNLYHEGKASVPNSSLRHDAAFSESPIDASSDSSFSDDTDGKTEEEELNSMILSAALPFVKDYGWTSTSISKGAESLGYSSMVHGMFDKGGTDLVNFFYSHCNSLLESELRSIADNNARDRKIKTPEFIRQAVEVRLRMNIEYKDSWAKALVLHASPSNFPTSLNNIGTLVDTICYYAGDRSYDFTWYTKRGTLVAIYKATELCMLQDHSDDFQETWSFLDRRLNDAMTFGRCVKEAEDKTKDLATLLQVGAITMQNILGISIKSK